MSLIVGTLKVDASIPESFSLKDKRRILKSLMDRIKNKFNVSIAQVDKKDSLQLATFAVAVISDEQEFILRQLQSIMSFIRDEPRIIIIRFERELL